MTGVWESKEQQDDILFFEALEREMNDKEGRLGRPRCRLGGSRDGKKGIQPKTSGKVHPT